MDKTYEWAAKYVFKVETMPNSEVLEGAYAELYDLARAIVADAEADDQNKEGKV